MSPEELARERADFWATRVTGIPDVWNYLKMACEALIEGARGLTHHLDTFF
jgi:hypothetical protein